MGRDLSDSLWCLERHIGCPLDDRARRLVTLAEGTPGKDWQPGEVCSKRRKMSVAFKDSNGAIARQLWEKSEEMVGLVPG